MIVEAQATPRLARKVIDCVRGVTDKPISHVVLTHYHAVRVLGASAYGADQIIMSDTARAMVVERGQEDWEITYRFAASPNVSGLVVGSITGINKKGWEYLWVRYAEVEDEDAQVLVNRPVAAYVERVYDTGNFAALGIGT